MASGDLDIKTFHDVVNFLKTSNNSVTAPPKPGAFTLFNFPAAPKNKYDLVYEGILLGEKSIAIKPDELKSIGVTHIVNASQGTKLNQTNTDASFYESADIKFHGIPAFDIITFKMLPHLRPAAEFIRQARESNGLVYVHCQQGVSRSASVVLAYLMLHKAMSLMEAVRMVREKREIFPNDGFLKQLCMLEKEIQTGCSSDVSQ